MFRFFMILVLVVLGYMYYMYGGEAPKKDASFKPVGPKVHLNLPKKDNTPTTNSN